MFVRQLGVLAFGLLRAAAFPQFPETPPVQEDPGLGNTPEDAPIVIAGDGDWESPVYDLLFRVPLPIPPVKEPRLIVQNPINGKEIWYFEVVIEPFTQRIYPNLRTASFVGYDGISPGPTFLIPRGTETVVRFINNAEKENSVHLHGSYSRAPWDGWAEDVTFPGEYKDYYYPNGQSARFIWYHDHAVHITAENAYNGQAGAYIITDPAEDALGLPSGYGEYDIPLVLSSRYYREDGTLEPVGDEDDSLWGDIIHVNGQPWPFMNVEPRKYRLRFLDAAVSRNFALYFALVSSLNSRLPFQVIASDAGLLTKPVPTTLLYLAVAERYEIVIDFSRYAGQVIELRNLEEVGGFGTDDDYERTDSVMRFVVGRTLSEPDTSVVPDVLRDVPFPPPTSSGNDHEFRFHRSNSDWLINGVGFADVQNRILANVPLGTVEIWELENGSGGWTHPIHIHLVDFKVIDRWVNDEDEDEDESGGERGVMQYEQEGLKDVVWLARHETVRVEAHYAPWPGVYMFHCHNLIHEDQDMMAAFNVTVLDDFGYNSTELIDPMEEMWRAVPYDEAEIGARSGNFSDEAITDRILFMASFNPYDLSQSNLE